MDDLAATLAASLATAAQAGAPLGHDFCVMSLSDNLKPWSIIEKRLDLAGEVAASQVLAAWLDVFTHHYLRARDQLPPQWDGEAHQSLRESKARV